MSLDVYKAFRQWLPIIDPVCNRTIADIPHYVIPDATASVIRHGSRRQGATLAGIRDAVVADAKGVVLFLGVHAPQHAALVSLTGFRVDRFTQASVPVSDMSFIPVLTWKYAVYQDMSDFGDMPFSWSMGECSVGHPEVSGSSSILPMDISCDLGQVKFHILGKGPDNIVTLAQMYEQHQAAGVVSPLENIRPKVLQDMGSAIGTAIEQLQHIQDGCSLRSALLGAQIVLTE